MAIDIEKLIEAIHQRSPIWDMRCSEYGDKFQKRVAWQQIVSLFVPETASNAEKKEMGHKLQAKWKNIRDRYARDCKKRKLAKSGSGAKRKKPYVYGSLLSFLGDIIEVKATASSLDNDKKKNNITEITYDRTTDISLDCDSPEADSREKPEKSFTKRQKMDPVDLKLISALDANIAAKKDAIKDDDFHFLMSLHPSLQNIPRHAKIACRLEIMQVIDKHIQHYS